MFNFFRKKPVERPELFFHTDIHCHLIPGIDDGQREADGGADLVAHEKEWGIERIIATPHVTQDTFENTPATIEPAFNKLKEAVARRGVEIELLHSAEYRMDAFFTSQLEQGLVKPMPNNYLLVENSFIQEAWNLDKMLFDLKMRGYKPILAHPERYVYYFPKKERYRNLHDAGTLFQINLLSLAGNYGKEVKQMASISSSATWWILSALTCTITNIAPHWSNILNQKITAVTPPSFLAASSTTPPSKLDRL